MKLIDLISDKDNKLSFGPYIREPKYSGMPPLEENRLALEFFIIENRQIIRSIVMKGDIGFIVNYKGKDGGAMSLSEEQDGDIWNIEVVSGAKSQKSLRIARSLKWRKYLADLLSEYAHLDSSEVKHITMLHPNDLENIDQAKSENVKNNYFEMIDYLRMRYSEEDKLFIRDIRKNLFEVF